jgi:pimeloyl-ACP methyl ester carboxylesterase
MTRRPHVVSWLWLASLVVVLAACGGSSTSTPVESPSARLQGMVDIGDRSLLLRCRGSGGPTVILEAGLADDLSTWDDVQESVSARTRVCAYNRANIGVSDAAPKPRTTADMVDDLEHLLAAADEPPPYVLVGFSFGGLVVQQFAATHADDVAGLVLVESNHPDEQRQFEAHLTRRQIQEDRAEVAGNPEGADVFSSFDEVRSAGPLPDVPLVVVTAGLPDEWPPGWDPRVFNRLRSRQQADLARLVPGGRQMFARQSGHRVPDEQPEVVVRALDDVLDRTGSG